MENKCSHTTLSEWSKVHATYCANPKKYIKLEDNDQMISEGSTVYRLKEQYKVYAFTYLHAEDKCIYNKPVDHQWIATQKASNKW